jgi:hypothetical protein
VTRATHLLAFLLPALVALVLGLQAHGRALVDLDTVAAMGNAWRVFHWQNAANMALIGFDQPPLMALLFVPLAAFAPGLLVSGLAAPILGAVFMGLSVLVIWRLSRSLGLPAWLAAILGAVFTLHPLTLSYAMTGSRGMVLTFVLLGLAASLVSWRREQRVRDVVTGSFFAAAAILLAYETLPVVLAAALYLALHARREGETAPAKAEGLLVAFLLPAAYVALVWIGANWAIMGDPWHFWPRGATALGGDVNAELTGAIAIALASSPLLLGLLYHGLRRKASGFAAPAAWLMLAALLAVLVFPRAGQAAAERYPWPQNIAVAACALGAGWALLVALLAQLWTAGRQRSLRRVLTPGLLLIACGSSYLAYIQQTQDHVLPVGVRTVLRGHPAFARSVADEWAAGNRLQGVYTANMRHVIAGPLAYVVALRSQAGQHVLVSSDSIPLPGSRHGDLGFGSTLILFEGQPGARDAWQQQKPELVLDFRWRQGPWGCYVFVSQELFLRRQGFARRAIIPAGTPHAHSRR